MGEGGVDLYGIEKERAWGHQWRLEREREWKEKEN